MRLYHASYSHLELPINFIMCTSYELGIHCTTSLSGAVEYARIKKYPFIYYIELDELRALPVNDINKWSGCELIRELAMYESVFKMSYNEMVMYFRCFDTQQGAYEMRELISKQGYNALSYENKIETYMRNSVLLISNDGITDISKYYVSDIII